MSARIPPIVRATARIERWPLENPFVISRSSRDHATVVALEIDDGEHRGRGECQPNPRYEEVPERVVELLESGLGGGLGEGGDAEALLAALPSPAARNALDCALWDLRAKRAGERVWELLGRPEPTPVETVFTISLGEPQGMAEEARRARDDGRTLLKLKLGGEGDDARVAAVRRAVPDARLVVDANEAWPAARLGELLQAMADAGVAMVEQPLPAGRDAALADVERPVPVCADESCHTAADVPGLAGRYDLVNIKLDKTGGLTGAIALAEAAAAAALGVMVGCMLGTSLAMAPAQLVASHSARFADLDGPLLLSRDREHPLVYGADGRVGPPTAELWG